MACSNGLLRLWHPAQFHALMNAATDQDMRTALLESCHPASLVTLLQQQQDPESLKKILGSDAAACAVAVEALCAGDAAPSQGWSVNALATSSAGSGLTPALTTLALQRLRTPLSRIRATTLHQCHQQSLARAHLARQLARDLEYPDVEEAYLMGLLLHLDQLLPTASVHSSSTPITLAWFQRWKFPIAAQDALRYANVPVAELQGLHLLTLVLRLADDYSNAERQSSCPPSPILEEALAQARQQAALCLPETPDSALTTALAIALNQTLPATQAAPGPAWAAELRTVLGPIALQRFALDPARQVLHGESSQTALHYLRIPLASEISMVAAAFLQGAWTHFNTPDAAEVTSRIDEQICRLMERPHLIAIPETEGVWVVGLDDSQWMRYHAQQQQLRGSAHRIATPSVSPAQSTVSLQFCREVLHEASAPLTTVRNYLYVLGQQMPETAREELSLMRTELDRLSGILQQLRDAPKPGCEGSRPLNRVVRDAVRSLQMGRNIEAGIETDLDESLDEARVNANLVQQILINLILNALDTVPPASRLVVTTRRLLPASYPPHAQLEISDNGPGLPAEVQAQLFEPKAQFQPGHSGLGLSIVHKLVAQLGGGIQCSSTPRGTRFQIIIPLQSPQEPVHGAR